MMSTNELDSDCQWEILSKVNDLKKMTGVTLVVRNSDFAFESG